MNKQKQLHFFKRIEYISYKIFSAIIVKHLLENKNHTASHKNLKKNTTFVINKRSVTYLRKCPIIQYIVSDSGHTSK